MVAAGCICARVDLGDGEHRIEWPAVECPEHGRPPGAAWRAGDPLRRHAKVVDRNTGAVMTVQDARDLLVAEGSVLHVGIDPWVWSGRFRDESPYEVEQRLLAESRT